jgi:hypothetical protein
MITNTPMAACSGSFTVPPRVWRTWTAVSSRTVAASAATMYVRVLPSCAWRATAGDAPTRFSSHAPELTVSGVTTSVATASGSTSQISRRRAAGHNAQTMARIAVSGPNTTTKWLSRI